MHIKALNYSSSRSNLIGNVTSYLITQIRKKFPMDYFKTVHVSRSLVSLEQEKNNDIYNKVKPILIVNPVWEIEPSIMEPHPFFFNPANMVFKNLRKYYDTMLYDRPNRIGIYGCPDKIRLRFDIQIIVETEMEALNMMNALCCEISPNDAWYHDKVVLEEEIPKPFINAIKKHLNIDDKKQEDRERFEKYLLDNSMCAIVERRNLASGNLVYNSKYVTNILWRTGDVPTKEVEYKDMIQDRCVINYTINLEVTNHSNYILDVPESFDYKSMHMIEDDKSNFVFNFTVPVDYIKLVRDDGLHLVYKKKFICDMNEEVEVLPFESILSDDLISLLKDKDHKTRIINEELVDIDLYTNSRQQDHSEYTINWNTMELTLLYPKSNENYYFAFYSNLEELNKMLIERDDYERTKIKPKKENT